MEAKLFLFFLVWVSLAWLGESAPPCRWRRWSVEVVGAAAALRRHYYF